MKVELDENLGRRVAAPLVIAGHDVATVAGQQVCGAEDRRLLEFCRDEGRCLVTLDREFADPLRYPPAGYAGIVVIRIPGQMTAPRLTGAMRTLAARLDRSSMAGQLWIVEPGRTREHQGEEP